MPGTYISPADLGFYYLNSRYYDPVVGRFINADSYISTGQGLLGNNMFAYCGNEPVFRVDPIGNMFCYLGPLTLCGGGPDGYGTSIVYPSYYGYPSTNLASGANAGACGGTIVDGTSIIAAILLALSRDEVTTTDVAEDVAIDDQKLDPERIYTVYTLSDAFGKVQYVGRTNCYNRRIMEHSYNINRSGLSSNDEFKHLTKNEARVVEQMAIVYYKTLNKTNKMNNQINGISEKKWPIFHDAAVAIKNSQYRYIMNDTLTWVGG